MRNPNIEIIPMIPSEFQQHASFTQRLKEINAGINSERDRQRGLIVKGATGLLSIACVAAGLFGFYTYPTAHETTFQLVAIHASGESDIVDYDLTAADCFSVILADTTAGLTCEETGKAGTK